MDGGLKQVLGMTKWTFWMIKDKKSQFFEFYLFSIRSVFRKWAYVN